MSKSKHAPSDKKKATFKGKQKKSKTMAPSKSRTHSNASKQFKTQRGGGEQGLECVFAYASYIYRYGLSLDEIVSFRFVRRTQTNRNSSLAHAVFVWSLTLRGRAKSLKSGCVDDTLILKMHDKIS